MEHFTTCLLCMAMTALLVVGEGSGVDRGLALRDLELRLRAALETRAATSTKLNADKYLERYGYLAEAPPNVQRSPEERITAIKDYQRMNGLRITGKLDRATRQKMHAPRCGNPDVVRVGHPAAHVQSADQKNQPVNFYVPGYKWRKTSLSWRVLNTSPDTQPGQQRRAFANALRHWSDVSGLSFEEMSSGNADLSIKFASGNHGDGVQNAFDRQGGVLAHAFYPENGEAHFDEAEAWSLTGSRGTHLETVATHEFGHALGLGHSNVPQALMAPYYKGYNPDMMLHDDDVRAIQSLYGGRPATPHPGAAPTPGEADPDVPDICTMKYDAMALGAHGGFYVFKGNKVWLLNTWTKEQGYPVAADSVFNRLPHNVGAAAFSNSTHYTYFFKGRSIYKYYNFHRIDRITIRGSRYPTSPQAAFMSRSGKIYVFQGANLWEFDEIQQRYTQGPTRISAVFPGLPANLEAAVRQNGYLLAVKGEKYRKYDEYGRRTMPGYPRRKAAPFMGPACGGRYVPK